MRPWPAQSKLNAANTNRQGTSGDNLEAKAMPSYSPRHPDSAQAAAVCLSCSSARCSQLTHASRWRAADWPLRRHSTTVPPQHCEAPARNPPVACARPFFARDRRAQRPVVHWCGRWCTAPTRIPPSRCSMWTRQQRAAAGTRSEGPVRLSPARRRVARRWRSDQERRVSP